MELQDGKEAMSCENLAEKTGESDLEPGKRETTKVPQCHRSEEEKIDKCIELASDFDSCAFLR